MGRVCLSINGYCQRALDDIINFLIGQFPFKARMVNHKKTGADMGFVLAYLFLEICCGLGITCIEYIHFHGIAAHYLKSVWMALGIIRLKDPIQKPFIQQPLIQQCLQYHVNLIAVYVLAARRGISPAASFFI